MAAQVLRIACAVFIVALCAVAPRPAPYRVELACGSSPCMFPIPVFTERYARLQTYVTTVRLSISPASAVMPVITWRSEDESRVTVTPSNPFVSVFHFAGDAAPVPTPDPLVETLLPGRLEGHRIIQGEGATNVIVEIGPPVNRRINVPVFAYRTVELGCYFESLNGIRFAGGIASGTQRPQDSDVYVTGPSGNRDFFNTCGPNFTSDEYTIHAPYGATIVSAPFNTVAPAAWRNEFRETPLSLRASGVLLAKTRNGSIVKIELQSEQRSIQGRYLVTDGARFADDAQPSNQ